MEEAVTVERSMPGKEEFVTCSFVVFECELFWFGVVTGFPGGWSCLAAEPVVVEDGWVNTAATESCFGVTLSVEGVFGASSPGNFRKGNIC